MGGEDEETTWICDCSGVEGDANWEEGDVGGLRTHFGTSSGFSGRLPSVASIVADLYAAFKSVSEETLPS